MPTVVDETELNLWPTGLGTQKPHPADRVTVDYSGWTTDGKMFDSSIPRGETVTFPLSQASLLARTTLLLYLLMICVYICYTHRLISQSAHADMSTQFEQERYCITS